MSIEWSRATIINLLNAYKKEDILYNQLSALYHNKQARNASWTRILKAVNVNKFYFPYVQSINKINLIPLLENSK